MVRMLDVLGEHVIIGHLDPLGNMKRLGYWVRYTMDLHKNNIGEYSSFYTTPYNPHKAPCKLTSMPFFLFLSI